MPQQNSASNADRQAFLPLQRIAFCPPPVMVKIVDQRRQNQQPAIRITNPGLSGQHRGGHHHMGKMARMVIVVAAPVPAGNAGYGGQRR